MEILEVVNRTSDKLEYLYDGQAVLIPVGSSHHEARAAWHCFSKLIRNMDPITLRSTHLIGLKKDGKELTPCSMLDMGAKPATEELFDRSKSGDKTETRKVGGGEITIEHGGVDSGMVGATSSADQE